MKDVKNQNLNEIIQILQFFRKKNNKYNKINPQKYRKINQKNVSYNPINMSLG